MTAVAQRIGHNSKEPRATDRTAEMAEWFLDRLQPGALARARRRLWFKAAVIALIQVGGYSLVMFGRNSRWLIALGVVALIVGVYGSIAAVMHDANHGASAGRRSLSHLLGAWVEVNGGSALWWRHKHNDVHHLHANIVGEDPDIEVAPILRLDPTQRWHWWHRLQHLYAWGAYLFMIVHVSASDLINVPTRRHGLPLSLRGFIGFIAGKGLFLVVAGIIPWLVLGWKGVVGSLFVLMAAGLCLAVTVQLAHAVAEVEHYESSIAAGEDFVTHQANVSCDVTSGSNVGGWLFRQLCGGLDRQVAHHLAPTLPHTLYPALDPLIDELLAERGIQHRRHRSIPAAIASHYRWLRDLGRRPLR